MRHAATAISLCIALVSGIVLALLWDQTSLRSTATSSDVEETALAFYQAVNTYLDGGDDTPLRRILHPDFVNHDSGSSVGGNAADFMQQLESIRNLYPGIQLVAGVVYLGNNAASVSLSLSDQQQSEFASIGIDPVEMVGRLDLVRIERRLIIERWASATLAGELDAFPAIALELPVALNTLLARVRQLSLGGASEPMTNLFGHLLLIVQSGDVRLNVMDAATIPTVKWRVDDGRVAGPESIEPGTTVTLDQMEAVLLPARTTFRIWDDGYPDATLLSFEFGPPVSGELSSPILISDESGATLWSGISLSDVGKQLTLSFGYANLLPQATLSNQQVEGMELTWVSDGSIDMSASGGTARVRDTSGVRSQLDEGHALLQAGDAGAVGPGSAITYRVAGNATAAVWFFSLVPTDGGTSATDDSGGPSPTPTPRPRQNIS